MTWMLDDGPLGILAQAGAADWTTWRPATLHISEAVAAAAQHDASGRRQALLSLQVSGESVVEVHPVRIGSDASDTLFGHLRPATATASRDLGEDESIALLIHELVEAVFVVVDRKAAMVALAELGRGRVASPFDYWWWLLEQRIIDRSVFDDLCARLARSDSGFPGVPVRF